MSDMLAELFSLRIRAAVLAHVLPRPHIGLSLTDLSRRLDLRISRLQHECYKLTRLGVLRDRRVGASRLYRPDPAWPLHSALTSVDELAAPATTWLDRLRDDERRRRCGLASSKFDWLPTYLAVKEMVLWLEEEHGFDRAEAYLLLSLVGHGRLGNWFSAYYVLPKDYLPQAT